MKIGAVITAAGKSLRMGSFKPLLKIGDLSVAEHVIKNFQAAGIKDIVLVTGYNAEELENSLRCLDLVFLRNDMYEYNKMFDSVKIGLQYFKDTCEKILLTPVDVPLFTADIVKALLECKANVGIPLYREKTGHPVILDNTAINKILMYIGSGGLRGAITNLSLKIEYIKTRDKGILYDVDTQEDYTNILKLYAQRSGKRKGY